MVTWTNFLPCVKSPGLVGVSGWSLMSLHLKVSFGFVLKNLGDSGRDIERIESEFFKGAEKVSYEMANKLIDQAVNEEPDGGLLPEGSRRNNRSRRSIRKSINSIRSGRSVKNVSGVVTRKDVGLSLNVPVGAAGRKSPNRSRRMSKMVQPLVGTFKNKKN
jgi:hypothetical protein